MVDSEVVFGDDIKDLYVVTSHVFGDNLEKIVRSNLVPVFVSSISEENPLWIYRGSMIHFMELAPSKFIWERWKRKEIDFAQFQKEYLGELNLSCNPKKTLRKMELLKHLSRSSGVAIVGNKYNHHDDPMRVTIGEWINSLGILSNPIREWRIVM